MKKKYVILAIVVLLVVAAIFYYAMDREYLARIRYVESEFKENGRNVSLYLNGDDGNGVNTDGNICTKLNEVKYEKDGYYFTPIQSVLATKHEPQVLNVVFKSNYEGKEQLNFYLVNENGDKIADDEFKPMITDGIFSRNLFEVYFENVQGDGTEPMFVLVTTVTADGEVESNKIPLITAE